MTLLADTRAALTQGPEIHDLTAQVPAQMLYSSKGLLITVVLPNYANSSLQYGQHEYWEETK